VLYAVNTNFGGTSRADLVMIEERTGKVTKVGPLPNDTDALAFGPALAPRKGMSVMPKDWRLPALALLAVIVAGFVVVVMRSGKR
jgi:hypothetical protein